MRPVSYWQWEGKVDGFTYFTVGVAASAVKFAVDWLTVTRVFHRPWNPLSYWRPFGVVAGIRALNPDDRLFAAVMLAIAVPFLWLGLAMTVKRLRHAGWPAWLSVLFFAPFVNFAFFALLSVLPAGSAATPSPGPRFLDGWIPRNKFGSALVSIALAAVLGLCFTFLGAQVFGSYGWSLFVGLPFCLGLFSVLIYSYHGPRPSDECLAVAILPITVLAAVLLIVAIEGVICILMAAPLALGMSLLGGYLGTVIQAAYWGRRNAPAILSMMVLLSPGMFGIEQLTRPQAGVLVVKSAIVIAAPPAEVWQKVVAFAEIPAPTETIFRAGIAYPIRAEIVGHGPGAIRRCIFSTGPFVEPITIWDEPRLLRFSVTANPAPMNELTPYGHIDPRHLHGYFESHQGQFLLTELPGGRTRLEGTTWYSHSLWPEAYWHWWSDYIIHHIHMRVLNHIRAEAENPSL